MGESQIHQIILPLVLRQIHADSCSFELFPNILEDIPHPDISFLKLSTATSTRRNLGRIFLTVCAPSANIR